MFSGDLDDHFVHFDHGDGFDSFVSEDFAEGSSWSSSDEGNCFGVGVGDHGGVDECFVVFFLGVL